MFLVLTKLCVLWLMFFVLPSQVGGKIAPNTPISCENSWQIPHGSIRLYMHGSMMIVTCDKDYILRGSKMHICSLGKWLGNKPVCESVKSLKQSLDDLRNETTFAPRYKRDDTDNDEEPQAKGINNEFVVF